MRKQTLFCKTSAMVLTSVPPTRDGVLTNLLRYTLPLRE